jgi:hypothetical protein
MRGRAYTIDSGQIALTGTTQTPLLMGNAGTTVTADVTAVRCNVVSGTGVVYPTNGDVQLYLARAANTPAGGTGVTPRPMNPTDIAANSVWTVGSWSTAPTFGNIVWGQAIPFAAGGNWGEVFDRDYERRLGGTGVSAFWAIFATLSATSTATSIGVELDFIE